MSVLAEQSVQQALCIPAHGTDGYPKPLLGLFQRAIVQEQVAFREGAFCTTAKALYRFASVSSRRAKRPADSVHPRPRDGWIPQAFARPLPASNRPRTGRLPGRRILHNRQGFCIVSPLSALAEQSVQQALCIPAHGADGYPKPLLGLFQRAIVQEQVAFPA